MENKEGRVQFTVVETALVGSNIPNPCSPDPALFETAVRFVTSFLFARAPIRVSGVPQSPNPRQKKGERVLTHEQLSGSNRQTSAQQCITGFYILNSLIYRVPNLAFTRNRVTRGDVQMPECLCRPGCLQLDMLDPRKAGTVRSGGRMSGYRLEEHPPRGGDRCSSSSKKTSGNTCLPM